MFAAVAQYFAERVGILIDEREAVRFRRERERRRATDAAGRSREYRDCRIRHFDFLGPQEARATRLTTMPNWRKGEYHLPASSPQS